MSKASSNDGTASRAASRSIFSSDFWKSLPGLLTAVAALIGAMTAAVALLYPKPQPASSPTQPTATAPQPAPAGAARFEVVRAPDGFLSLRLAPSRTSRELRRVPVGEQLTCGPAQMNSANRPWRRCRTSDGLQGFASDYYLEKAS